MRFVIPTLSRQLVASVLAAAVLAPLPVMAGPPVFKCLVDGAVTYQHLPCAAPGERSATPTVQQLNAERQKKLRQAASAAAAAEDPRPAAPGASAPAPAAAAFTCDGRTRCTQMRSCAEAKFFLAHCPGVQMDGNHDGVPCQKQWCNR